MATVTVPTDDEVQSPCIHLNGTSQDSLLETRSDAYYALQLAYDAVKQTAPNGRDYYVAGDDKALQQATDQHMARLKAIEVVMKSIEREMELISAQE